LRAKRIVLLVVLALAGLTALAFIGVAVLWHFTIPSETHSLRKYAGLRARWDQKLVGHFPESIPETAGLKKFSHFPGFLQGGAHIQLRLELPRSEIKTLRARFLQERTKSFFGGDTNDHMNVVNGMPTTFFMTGEEDQHEFPADYEVMIFDPVLPESERPDGHYWNHGQSHGVAISEKRNEIIYWAESW